MIESNRIEFKRELTKELDIEREVVAFLNYREGGIIYIGITPYLHLAIYVFGIFKALFLCGRRF